MLKLIDHKVSAVIKQIVTIMPVKVPEKPKEIIYKPPTVQKAFYPRQ